MPDEIVPTSEQAATVLAAVPQVFRAAGVLGAVGCVLFEYVRRGELFRSEGFDRMSEYATHRLGIATEADYKKTARAGVAAWQHYADRCNCLVQWFAEGGGVTSVTPLGDLPTKTALATLPRALRRVDAEVQADLVRRVGTGECSAADLERIAAAPDSEEQREHERTSNSRVPPPTQSETAEPEPEFGSLGSATTTVRLADLPAPVVNIGGGQHGDSPDSAEDPDDEAEGADLLAAGTLHEAMTEAVGKFLVQSDDWARLDAVRPFATVENFLEILRAIRNRVEARERYELADDKRSAAGVQVRREKKEAENALEALFRSFEQENEETEEGEDG